MKDQELFEVFEKLMDFFEEVLGASHELVLQDLREPMHIVDIRNAIDPTRVKGGAASEFARLIMSDPDKYSGISFVTNYKGVNVKEDPNYTSSTYIIRGARDKIIGLLCINTNVGHLTGIRDLLDGYIRRKTRINIGDTSFSGGVLVDVSKIVDDGMAYLSGNPAAMSLESKKQLVGNLSDRGIFLVRGAVTEVAKRLDVSEQTIYRYMKEN